MKHLLLLCLSALSLPAHATYFTGNELLEMLDSKSAHERGMAHGIIIGVTDLIDGRSACIPEGVTVGQLNAIVADSLRKSPALLHYRASWQVSTTLLDTFPCKK